MLLLSLALLAAPAALPVAEPQRHARSTRARRGRVRTQRLTIAIPIVPIPHDRNAKYRISESDQRIDFKTRVVERGAFANCGVTGSSICPSKGMPIIKTDGE